jgi:MFS family permease
MYIYLVYIYMCTYIYIYIYMHIHVYIRICIYMHVHIHIYIYLNLYINRRLVVTAPLGYVSDAYRHKLPLILSSTMLLLGSVLWANAFYFNKLPLLYFAQFTMGVGSGSLGVTRYLCMYAYV